VRYEEAIAGLYALSARGMRPGIERMRDALVFRGLDAARLQIPLVQVAGTNGKGSVACMISEGLRAAGYRTGLYSSPHLHRFTERVRIDGRPLATREAARRVAELLAWSAEPGAPELSFFELGTLLAVEAFVAHRCDVAVIEVGLGGRLDATTALPATLSVITRIAMDHEALLGDSLPKIAAEKAGIIRAGVPVVVGSPGRAVQRVISAHARRMRAPLTLVDRDFRVLPGRGSRAAFEVRGRRIAGVQLGLAGEHQRDNAAIAAAALCELAGRGLPVPVSALRQGLAKARWPARLERHAAVGGGPALLFDAAHNPDGCAALARELQRERVRPRVLIFGAMADKDYPQMLALLAPHVEHVIYLQPQLPRAATPEQLQGCLPGAAANGAADALRRARRAASGGGVVICAGSIFAVAELRARALRLRSDPLIRM